ncbi:hypothetical protein ACWGB8_22525 [Kitasatospora sp. NPDC054939]
MGTAHGGTFLAFGDGHPRRYAPRTARPRVPPAASAAIIGKPIDLPAPFSFTLDTAPLR